MATPLMKTILLATNLQEYNKVAFDVASTLAAHHQAKLVLLHVLEKIPKSVEAKLTWLFGEEDRKKVIESQTEKARKTLTGKSITSSIIRSALDDYCKKSEGEGGMNGNPIREVVVAEGEVAGTILLNAKDFDATMIVLGTHEGLVSTSAISKTVKNVLKNSMVPVLIVPSSFS